MSLLFRVTAAAAVVCIASTLAVGDGKKSKEINGWGTVTDPDGDCTFKEDRGKLTITVPGNLHDLHATRGMNAPRVLREVEGDFTATVKVTCALTPGKGVAKGANTAGYYAGLLLWAGEKEYVRLERNALWGGGKLVSFTPLFEYWKDGGMRVASPRGGAPDFFKPDSTWFQLERKGGKVTARYSDDGKEWAVAQKVDTELPKKLHVGVAAINSSDTRFIVEFGDLKVEASK
jgi:hypothetical protein